MGIVLLAILLSAVSAFPVVRVKNCPAVLPTDATPRIVGGNEASPRTRSHVVSFYEEGCGGSLLSDVWVLTAAHCLVHDGSVARISGSNSSNGIEIPVKRVIDHPDYEFPVNDITLVELESPAPPSATFMAVNGNPSIPKDGEYARVAGYGFQEEGFDLDHDALLRQVDIPVMNTQKCIDRYFSVHSYLREDISSRNHICAGYDAGGCDSCTADSGGPLYVYDSQNTPVQIAIVSFGYGCAREVPGGYTRVSTYVSWMKSVGAVFAEKTARVARFGDSVSGSEGTDPETEEKEEQIDESGIESLLEQASNPSPTQASEAVSSAIPLAVEPDTFAATPDETEPVETPGTPQASSQPSPPARLPPHQAVSPPPSVDKPYFSDSQGGHGGEVKPRPQTSGSATEEPVPTVEDEDNEGLVSIDGNDSEVSPSDTSPSDVGTSDNIPSHAIPSDDIPSDASPNDASPSYDSPIDDNPSDGILSDDSPSDAMDAESEEDEPAEPENDTAGSEVDDDGSEDEIPGESEMGDLDEGAAATSEANPSNPENSPDLHRPAPLAPQGEQGIKDEQHDERENGSASEGEGSNGSETEIDVFIEDDSGDGSINDRENGTESESNGVDESGANDSVGALSEGEIGNGPGNSVGPIFSPGPSSGLVVPPSETMTEGFEELEPSGSPEVTESPDVLSGDAGFDAEGGSLGALAITMIAIGSVLILAVAGYLIYHIASRREQ